MPLLAGRVARARVPSRSTFGSLLAGLDQHQVAARLRLHWTGEQQLARLAGGRPGVIAVKHDDTAPGLVRRLELHEERAPGAQRALLPARWRRPRRRSSRAPPDRERSRRPRGASSGAAARIVAARRPRRSPTITISPGSVGLVVREREAEQRKAVALRGEAHAGSAPRRACARPCPRASTIRPRARRASA